MELIQLQEWTKESSNLFEPISMIPVHLFVDI
jgi:hypothetical protein